MKFWIFLIALFSPWQLSAKALKFDKIKHSQLTLTKEITSVFRSGNVIYETSHYEDFLIRAKYNPSPKENELPFGSLRNDSDYSERIPFPKRVGRGYWRGVVPYRDDFMILEGRKKKVVVMYSKNSFSIFSDIIMDRFKPARDSRGEPTKWEIRTARNRFAKNLQKLGGGEVVLSGIAPLPKKWGGKGQEFLVLTRIEEFPIFLMSCSASDGIVCQLKRHCFVEGIPHHDDLTGIGVSTARRQILIASHKNQKIYTLAFRSCFRIVKNGELSPPKKLRPLRSVHVDSGDNLWLATDFPDDYRNSSVYRWDKENW